MLQLTRPLIVYDLETTGIRPGVDRITQIAAIKIWPGDCVSAAVEMLDRAVASGKKFAEADSLLCQTINPETAVRANILELTHLTQEELNASSTFAQWADWLKHFFFNSVKDGKDYGGVDLHGFNNSKFDNSMIEAEFKNVNIDFKLESRYVVDSHQVFVKQEPRTLAAAYTFYCGEEMEGAHNALVDIAATFKVLLAQMARYEDMPDDVPSLDKYCLHDNWIDRTGKFKWDGADAVLGFGKHAGKTLMNVATTQSGFLTWMLRGDFPSDAKKIAKDALNGIYPKQEN